MLDDQQDTATAVFSVKLLFRNQENKILGNSASGFSSAPLLGLLVNSSSRRSSKQLASIIQIAKACPRMHHSITESPDEVSGTLKEFADKSVNVLAICGGDGTVSRVLTHLLDEKPFEDWPLIAILPGGTANMTAGDVGFRGSVLKTLHRLSVWSEKKSDDGQIIQVMLWLSILVVIGGFPFAQLYRIEIRLNVEDGGTHLLEITRYPLVRFFLGRIDVAWDRKKVFTERTALDHMAPVDFKFGNSRVHDGRVVRDRLPKRDGPSGLQRLYKSREPLHVFIDGQDLGEL